MISVSDTLNPVTGGPLTYRAVNGTYNNSWNWNIHYRAAVSYITGSNTFKVGFNNAFLHHENTTYSAPAMPYSYNFTSMVADLRSPTASSLAPSKSMSIATWGFFAQDKWTTGRWTLSGRDPTRLLQEQLPSSRRSRHVSSDEA